MDPYDYLTRSTSHEEAAAEISKHSLFTVTAEDVAADRKAYNENKRKSLDVDFTPAHENPNVAYTISMPHAALHAALQRNQFKNMFQVGNIGSVAEEQFSKPQYIIDRKGTEQAFFGIPKTAKGNERPIYGIIRDKTSNTYGIGYGNAQVDMKKPGLSDNVTATYGDSLNTYGDLHSEDEAEAVHHSDVTTEDAKKIQPYVEVQWHTGSKPLPRTDIENVDLVKNLVNNPLPVVDGELDKSALDKAHAHHERIADYLRNAGLNSRVNSKVGYSYREPTLFDTLPDAEREGWVGEMRGDISSKEVWKRNEQG